MMEKKAFLQSYFLIPLGSRNGGYVKKNYTLSVFETHDTHLSENLVVIYILLDGLFHIALF